ncbi:MAG: YdcH family protein [Phenylobacterium sp.]|nr:YdcH family protein [Phenylobacterium sp.]
MNHARIWRLRHRHRQLEQLLRRELQRPRPDPLVVQDLKRRKLQVKDDLFMAEAGLVPATRRFHPA